MSLQLDDLYMNQMEMVLDSCVKTDRYVWNFRCPYCGDSETDLSKKRGYVYMNETQDGLFFKCHNCSETHPFGIFIKDHNPTLYKEYVIGYLKESGGYIDRNKPKENTERREPIKRVKCDGNFYGLPKLSDLPDDHIAVKDFFVKRKLPDYYKDKLYYSDNFRELFVQLNQEKDPDKIPEDKRVIIPFVDDKGNLTHIQARALSNSKMRYFSVKIQEDSEKLYGLDTLDPDKRVYIVEGPIDSMFIDNAIATADASLYKAGDKFKDSVCVFDCQPKNKDLRMIMKKTIDLGYKVCILPNLGPKDINDMVLSGFTKLQIKELIDNNTYKGLKAHLMLGSWV